MKDMDQEINQAAQPETEAQPETPAPRRRRSDRYRQAEPEDTGETIRIPANREPEEPPKPRVSGAEERRSPYAPPAGHSGAPNRLRMQQGGGAGREAPPSAQNPYAKRPSIRVGYEPGRMEERYSAERQAATQRARTVPETRFDPARRGRPVIAPAQEEPKQKRHVALSILVILLVVIGLAEAGLMLLPKNQEIRKTAESFAKQAVALLDRKSNVMEDGSDRVTEYVVTGSTGLVAPDDVTFSVQTVKSVTAVRLADTLGKVIKTDTVQVENTDGNAWILRLHVEDGFAGDVGLQIQENGKWMKTDRYTWVNVEARPSVEGTESGNPATDSPRASEGGGGDSREGDTGIAELSTPEPTPEPTPTLTPEPTATPTPKPTATPTQELTRAPTQAPTETPTPLPTEVPALEAKADSEADPSLISNTAVYTGSKKVKDYARPAKELIKMPVGGEYTKVPMGILTFRTDAFRQNAATGIVENPRVLEEAWKVEAGSARGASQTYYGIGWTGQPVIVKWSKQVRAKSNFYESKLEKSGLKEVIIAGLDGIIYFLDLEDGSITRNSIKLGYPMKGTPSLHPGGAPFMTVGQFARKMKVKTGQIGLRQYNLYSQKEMKLIDGMDGKLHRAFNNVGSFETSALIDRTSDTMITAGSNGLLYLISLGSTFDYETGVYTQSPSTTVLKAKAKTEKKESLTAVEASVAMYNRYVFYADMGGVLRCVDTNTLKAVWAVQTGDAVESTVALELNDEGGLDLYTANMLLNRSKGAAQVRRYDALSGREIWVREVSVKKDGKTTTPTGFRASPVVGQQRLSDLVYYTVTGLSDAGRQELGLKNEEPAALIALEKDTGKVAWAKGLDERTESSPVAVYDENGSGWIIQCTGSGNILLLEGETGNLVTSLQVEGAIEGSPAVYQDTMVVGTTGKKTSFIYGIKILSEPGQNSRKSAETSQTAEEAGHEAGEPAEDTGEEAGEPAEYDGAPVEDGEMYDGEPVEDDEPEDNG